MRVCPNGRSLTYLAAMTRQLIVSLSFVFALSAIALTTTRPLSSFQFTSHEGKTFKLGDLSQNYLVVSFVFTSCPMPQMCPLTLNIAKQALDEWQKLPVFLRWLKPLHVLAITIDPERDTPPVLMEWTKRHSLENRLFTFATGSPQEITDFAARFNVSAFPSGNTIAHNVRTIILNPKLEVVTEFRDNEEELGKELTGKAVIQAVPPRPGRLLLLSGALVIIAALGSAIIKQRQKKRE